MPTAGGAAVFEAGPDSIPPRTIQEAIDAALLAGGANEVRIRGVEIMDVATIEVTADFDSGELLITGGWNSDFDAQSAETPTIVDGDGAGSVFSFLHAGGTIVVEDVEVTGGDAGTGTGGGFEVRPTGTARFELRRANVHGNTAKRGGGVFINSADSSATVLEDNTLTGNFTTSTTSTAVGGGLEINARHDSIFTVTNNDINDNTATSGSNQVTGAGVYLRWCEGIAVAFEDNRIGGNTGTGNSVEGSGGALWQQPCTNAFSDSASIRRNQWTGNDGGTGSAQISMITNGAGVVLFTDSILDGEEGPQGISVDARVASELRLTNLTVTGHTLEGIDVTSVAESATVSLYNSIVWDNGTDLAGTEIDTGSNLIDVDPDFAGPGDLTPGAPAIDQGSESPPGGLGPYDVYHDARVVGAAPDIGAIEVPEPAQALLVIAALLTLATLRARVGTHEQARA